MKPLYTEKEFNKSKSKEKLPCECNYCKKTFYLAKTHIKDALNVNNSRTGSFCSRDCLYKSKDQKISYNCHNCGKIKNKKKSQIKLSLSGFNFCSKSCTTTYHNKNKTHGTIRSKLESWLEEQLTQIYPNLPIDFNKKNAIGSELDIYIPSLNIAIELNGIFHYEPIYGVNKLQKIQENDVSKSKACHEAKIDLCTIDTSGQKYFKESTSQKYLEIINNIIKERLTSLD